MVQSYPGHPTVVEMIQDVKTSPSQQDVDKLKLSSIHFFVIEVEKSFEEMNPKKFQ